MQASERFDNFISKLDEKNDITINVFIVDNLPCIKKAKQVFITYHFQDGRENWSMFEKNGEYFYQSSLQGKEQFVRVNSAFDKAQVYLIPKKNILNPCTKEYVWRLTDVIYDFLQVLLINYLAKNSKGIFTHAIGIKDVNAQGFLFAGKSGAGKSTTARLWYKHSRAMVLNDDRIIVCRDKHGFLIHGSPWHGEFRDYLESRIESAYLSKIFFIYHSLQNTAQQISAKEAFILLYPALFPAFWNKKLLDNISSFALRLVRDVSCYRLGFLNKKDIIDFVRKR